MKNKVLFIRSFTPDFDGRFKKYQEALDAANIEWHFLGWDRSGNQNTSYHNKITFFKKKALVGSGIKNIFNIILWNFFILKFLIKNRKQYSAIHIIDFDSAFFALPLAKLLHKKTIFDIYDKYTSSRNIPKFLVKIIDYLECLFIKKATYTLLVDISRVKQHKIVDISNIKIFENVPLSCYSKIQHKETFPLKIGYIGVFEEEVRGLENMLKIASSSKNIEFHIAGFGTIAPLIQKYANEYPDKIIYYGAVKHDKGMSIMSNMHLSLALYYKSVPNHLFAAPNKYYEHLMLGQPLITSLGTPPGDKVLAHKTGWAIEDNLEDLQFLISSINHNEISEYSSNAKSLWDLRYSKYTQEVYFNEYINIIKYYEK